MWTTDTVTAGRRATPRQLLLPLALLLPGALVTALACGAINLSPGEVWQGLTGTGDPQAAMIIGRIRLPRAVLAALMGANLAVSGAAMQGLFRNPLADPSLIGVTAGASLGASIVIVTGPQLGAGYLGLSLISIGAFLGGVLAVMLVYRLCLLYTSDAADELRSV